MQLDKEREQGHQDCDWPGLIEQIDVGIVHDKVNNYGTRVLVNPFVHTQIVQYLQRLVFGCWQVDLVATWHVGRHLARKCNHIRVRICIDPTWSDWISLIYVVAARSIWRRRLTPNRLHWCSLCSRVLCQMAPCSHGLNCMLLCNPWQDVSLDRVLCNCLLASKLSCKQRFSIFDTWYVWQIARIKTTLLLFVSFLVRWVSWVQAKQKPRISSVLMMMMMMVSFLSKLPCWYRK